eukprot:293251_1
MSSDEDYEINEPPHKRRKLNINEESDSSTSSEKPIPPTTHKFSGIDELQFIKLFRTIESCNLIQTLHIPTIINSEIAEYATGSVYNCLNKQCTNKIIKLNEDNNNGIYES